MPDNKSTTHNTPDGAPREANAASENPELGIKRVRTFAEDLALAKKQAGVVDEPKPQKQGFFGRKVKAEPGPEISSRPDLMQIRAPKQSEQTPEQVKTKQPSKRDIEKELAESGLIAESDISDEETGGGEAVKQPPEAEPVIPAIRTYKYDKAESIEHENLSRVSILAREAERRARRKDFSEIGQDSGTNSAYRAALILSVSALLIASGAFALWYIYHKNTSGVGTVTPISKNLLFTNTERKVPVDTIRTGSDFFTALKQAGNNVPSGTNMLTSLTPTKDGRGLTKDELFSYIPGASPRLVRTLDDRFVIGVYDGKKPAAFLLLKTNDFDTAFAAMLDWEYTMSGDLSPFFGMALPGTKFGDVLVQNKDTRLLKDRTGATALLYAFPNTETIVITTSEAAFLEIFNRLAASNVTQN